ncbi:MAG: beta-(1-6) glucans synthase [Gemmatimonas sp.]
MTTQPIAVRAPLALLAISLSLVAAVWWWLGQPVTFPSPPIDPAAKLDCVSYAPFQGEQTPFRHDLIISPQQIATDLAELSKVSRCVRTYSIDNGLDKVPELAARVGLKVILGVWIGRDHAKNAQLVDQAVSLVKDHPGVITAMIVGSEVLLRGEMTASDLRQIIRSAKSRVTIPVSYADVWEFWERYREVAADVDFVTIHILPYWEDFPVRAEQAAAHVDEIRKRMAVDFPGKEVLIGEAGWPSRGRMRDDALPSRINQARFVAELIDRARRENFRVNLFEAYDEPWKRQWEGTVGGSWGLFDGWTRDLKYPAGAAVSDYPFWKLQLAAGLAFSLCVFGAAFVGLRGRPFLPGLSAWVAVATCAVAGGSLFGMAYEKMLYESYGLGGWLLQGLLLGTATAAPPLCGHAIMAKRAVPAFSELIGPREGPPLGLPRQVLGFTLMLATLLAVVTALSLVFDGRWRDFAFASLTMAVVPFWMATLFNRPTSTARPIAEEVFGGLLALAALYIVFNEGLRNWQSVWTCAIYVLLGATLWRTRALPVGAMAPVIPASARAGLEPAAALVEAANGITEVAEFQLPKP